jgi:polysaccharide biosynthesis/export protein
VKSMAAPQLQIDGVCASESHDTGYFTIKIMSKLIKLVVAATLTAWLFGCATASDRAALSDRPTARNNASSLRPASCEPYCNVGAILPGPQGMLPEDVITQSKPIPGGSQLEIPDQASNSQYKIGPGDSITLTVFGHPEISGRRTVGPDGNIQVVLLGSVVVAGLTADQAGATLTRLLSDDYVAPVTSVQINSYMSNQVVVLGDVGSPGIVRFLGQPTLLEALAKAGTAKGLDGQLPASKCAIFRGRDRVFWIDLRGLYRGDALVANFPLQPNDVVYVPYNVDNVVYVMGQVAKPGAYAVSPNMSVVQALAQAGGPTENASTAKVSLARPSQNLQKDIDLDDLVKGDGATNYSVEAGDIVYVPKRGLAKVGYVLQQVSPITQMLMFAAVAAF